MRTLSKDEALEKVYTPSLKGYLHCSFYTLVDILGEPTFKWINCPINYEWAIEYKGLSLQFMTGGVGLKHPS